MGRHVRDLPLDSGELDLPLLIQAAADARTAGKGIWADAATLLAYEYRAMEKLHTVTKKIVENKPLRPAERFAWRERYCVDMRDRVLHGPEDYVSVPPSTGCGSGRWTWGTRSVG